MNAATAKHFASLRSQDRKARYHAFMQLLEATQEPVDWESEVWDDLVRDLADEDNHRRAIAAQLLCNLGKSGLRGRSLNDFDALLAVTRDERFVTARHSLQAIRKVGVAGERQRERVLEGLAVRFGECASERNCTLIHYDFAKVLRDSYDEVREERIRALAVGLINSEDDSKYRKKYEAVWRGVQAYLVDNAYAPELGRAPIERPRKGRGAFGGLGGREGFEFAVRSPSIRLRVGPRCPAPLGIAAENAGHGSARPVGGHASIADELGGLPAFTQECRAAPVLLESLCQHAHVGGQLRQRLE